MRCWVAFKFVCLVLAGVISVAAPVHAQGNITQTVYGNFEKPTNTAHATEFGKSIPPMGYVAFCGRGEDECKFSGGKATPLALTTENWDQIEQVNHYTNTKIRPVSDMELYHLPDYWTYPVTAGDCEDYALLKKRYLVGMGISPSQLLMTVVLDENHEGHAVLTVVTNKGDYVLDNRRNEVLRWDDTGYTFLKRQSQLQANQWVTLQKSAPQIIVSTKTE